MVFIRSAKNKEITIQITQSCQLYFDRLVLSLVETNRWILKTQFDFSFISPQLSCLGWLVTFREFIRTRVCCDWKLARHAELS